MPDDVKPAALPAAAPEPALAPFDTEGMPPSLRIMYDEHLFARVKTLAGIMADDEVMTPKHLQQKPQACFTVLTQALDWKISPNFVARSTYQTPSGSIGFEGKLVQAILERSNRFIGEPEREYVGDWQSIAGKFEKKKNAQGKDYVVPTWTDADATGLGIIVRWQVRGEAKPRVWPGEKEPFWLVQCFPLNSPLWATDPKTQIFYLAIRRFGNQAAPGILGGMPFDYEELLDASERARDITPPPQTVGGDRQREQPRVVEPESDPELWIARDYAGNELTLKTPHRCLEAIEAYLEDAERRGAGFHQDAWDQNEPTLEDLRRAGFTKEVIELEERFGPPTEGAGQPAEAAGAAQGEDDGWPGPDVAARSEQARPASPEPPAEASKQEARPDPLPPAATQDAPSASAAESGSQNTGDGETPAKNAYWNNPTEIAVPPRKPRGLNWPVYAEQMVRLIKTAPDDDCARTFRKVNAKQLGNLRLSYQAGYEEFEAAEREVIGTA